MLFLKLVTPSFFVARMANFKTKCCVLLLVLLVGAYAQQGESGRTFNGDSSNGNGHSGDTFNGVSDADGPNNKGGEGGEYNNFAAIQIPSLVTILVSFAAYVVA